MELVAEGSVAVTPKSVFQIEAVHEAELLSQLRLGAWRLGLLLNFNPLRMAEGMRRIVLSANK